MSVAAVVLAAGKGTRFRSDLAKVLHPAAGRTMLRWVLEALRPLGLDRVVVVVGHQGEAVAAEARAAGLPGLATVEQAEQLGTGHAVRAAFDAGALDGADRVLVLPGDTPLLRAGDLAPLLDERATVAMLTARLDDPTGYGRVVRDAGGMVQRVVEHRDATDAERAIDEINAGIYAFPAAALRKELEALSSANAQGEQYLTDVVAPMAMLGIVAVEAPEQAVGGVNDRAQLAAAAAVLRARVNEAHLLAGVTLTDPERTYIGADVRIAPDAVVLPNTHLEGTTRIGAGAVVGPDSRLVDAVVEDGATVAYSVLLEASVGPGATVGPFSYLRPGARLERGAKAGAFVEVKKSTIGEGSKVPHLSYIGDAEIGRDVNVGAGTITCNFDGRSKHRTVIGDGAFIGSDTMLVAPVAVGPGAVTAAGSAITRDVPADALALERNQQVHVDGYAARRRAQEDNDDESGAS
ncbi:MAG TPA: bifunctional UDP-N-acetylglucosamine diphosphorylase/glucosamine-1-phosphate N-acetyltransferase GlmU [Egibacteraceae bacterium]|nr:bifunctional UDP-N-acetylglucosamine diphosphorylase/glucosamine-1-phosphate N-acetyltransferase GlmU [Egibacteraceae bacterium]